MWKLLLVCSVIIVPVISVGLFMRFISSAGFFSSMYRLGEVAAKVLGLPEMIG